MMTLHEQVDDWIEGHRDELAEFLVEFADISSPRGHERDASEFLHSWLRGHDIEARTQPVVADRSNVIGRLPGQSADGSRLVFNAHLDTAYGNSEEDERILPERLRSHTEAWRDGDVLFGDSVRNDKGPMAAFLWAARAIDEVDVTLDGDLYLTGTVGEIGGTSLGEELDPRVLGSGIGTRRLVDSGITGDFAVVAETTDFAIARMECGVAWFEITVSGTPTYQPRLATPGPEDVLGDHPGALPDAARAVRLLEEWGSEYAHEHTREYDHGTMRPSAGVGAIQSGNPEAPIVAPGTATLYLDVRLPPGARPEFVRDEIAHVLQAADIDATVEPYLFRRGYVADDEAVTPLVDEITTAHERLFDTEPPAPKPTITSMWRDINVFNEVGVPAVTCGPPRKMRTVDGISHPCMLLDDLVAGAKLYAQTALRLCRTTD
jgi:acetylornithine deacetylase/succinyl-diaminopimelate desuccinylase-like protein